MPQDAPQARMIVPRTSAGRSKRRFPGEASFATGSTPRFGMIRRKRPGDGLHSIARTERTQLGRCAGASCRLR